MITPDSPDRVYSTRLRTALVLSGSGTAGAYHAGVLRALHEAGVKLDLVAGRGMGALSALFAAIDGSGRLWEPGGVWRSRDVPSFYGLRRSLRVAGWAVVAAAVILAVPMVLLAVAVLLAVLGLLLTLVGLGRAATAITTTYTGWIDVLFTPAVLPTIIPRLTLLATLVAVATLAAAVIASVLRRGARRRVRRGMLGRAFGGPLSTESLLARCRGELWNLIRGAAPLAAPPTSELGRRYVELLTDNQGQPGFRELVITVHDLDARQDAVFALLAPRYRPRFFTRSPAGEAARAREAFDLTGTAGDHAVDALAAALALPIGTDPHLVTFAPEGPWRGETHRFCDRPEALSRLFEEVALAGAEQVIVVSAASPASGAHELSAGRGDIRGRAGEQLGAFEAASLRDVLEEQAGRFAGLFVIRPPHNPVGPLDFEGVYDERSDRRHTLRELMERGYEDAYRQFIEPVVGASGDRMASLQP